MGDMRVRFRRIAIGVVVAVLASVLAVATAVPASAVAGASYEDAVLAADPLMYWQFDDAECGTPPCTAEDTQGTLDLSNSYPTMSQAGPILGGSALGWPSGNSSAHSGTVTGLATPQNLTMEFWVKSDSTGPKIRWGLHTFFAGPMFGSVFYFMGGNRSPGNGGPLPANEWGHVVVTVSGTQLRTYYNGDLHLDQTAPGVLQVSANTTVEIEATPGYSGLDELALYDRALTEQEILEHYEVGAPSDGVGSRPSTPFAGDPVDVSTGNLHVAEPELLSSPAGTYGLDWGQFYNSQDPGLGPLGRGWSSTLDARMLAVEPTDSGDLDNPLKQNVRLWESDGRSTLFENNPGSPGVWTAPDSVFAELSYDGTNGWYVLTWDSGEVWRFDGDSGWLVQKLERTPADGTEEASVPKVTIARDSEDLLTSATASVGSAASRRLAFTHSSGLLSVVAAQVPDGSGGWQAESPARAVTYGYTDDALTGITTPGGGGFVITPDVHDRIDTMSRITAAGSPPSTELVIDNQYDSEGRVNQQDTPTGQTRFTYDLVDQDPPDEDYATYTQVTFDPDSDPNTTTDEEYLKYYFDAALQLRVVKDQDGNNVTREWVAGGRLGSFTSRAGAETEVGYLDGRPSTRLLPDPGTGAVSSAGESWTYHQDVDSNAPGYCTSCPTSDPRPVTYTNAEGETTTYAYWKSSESPNLKSVPRLVWAPGADTEVEAEATLIDSDPDGLVDRVVDTDGVVRSYDWDETERELDSVTVGDTTGGADPDEVTTAYTYTDAGLVDTVTVGSSVTDTDYDAAGRATEVRTPRYGETGVHPVNYGYDDAGRVLWMSDESNPDDDGSDPTVAYTYTDAGDVETETRRIASGEHTTTRYEYDGFGRQQFVYEGWEAGSPATWESKTEYTYTILGRVYEETRHNPGGSNLVTRYSYDADGNQTHRIVDPGGAAELDYETVYDKRGRVTAEVDPAGVVTAYDYDEVDRVVRESVNSDGNPANNAAGEWVTEYVYDAAGRLFQTWGESGVQGSDADRPYRFGVVEERRYTDAGRLDVVLRPPQDLTSYTWPTDPLSDSTILDEHYGYDAAGRQVSVTDPEDRVSRTEYDAQGRVACELDPADTVVWVTTDVVVDCAASTGATHYAYDDAGNVTRIYQPSPTGSGEVSQKRTYTPTGQVATETDYATDPTAGGTPTRSFTYTDTGWVDTATDANGTQVNYDYDLRGNRTQRQSTTTAGAAPASCTTSSVATCVLQTWVYNPLGQLTETSDGLGRVTEHTYDTAGRSYQITDPSDRRESRTYDSAGRLDESTYEILGGTSFAVSHDYDPAGRRTKLTDPGGETIWVYDEAGNQITETLPSTDSQSWIWDVNGELRFHTATNGAKYRNTHTDAYELELSELWFSLYGVWVPAATYTYDAAGRETHEALYNAGYRDWDRSNPAGVVEEYEQTVPNASRTTTLTWQPDGRLASQVTGLACETYTYDPAGQLTDVVETDADCTSNPATLADYTYDGHGHRSGDGTNDWAWDLAGQLRGRGDGCELVSGVPDGDCDDTYTYDDAGRRTAADTTAIDVTYNWDEAGRLAQLTQDDGTVDIEATLHRNGDGTLVGIESTVGGGSPATTELVWDDTGGLPQIAESDSGSGDISYQIGRRRIQQQGDVYAYDHLDSSIDSDAQPSAPTDYQAFGEPDTDNNWPIYFGYRGELTLGLPEAPLVHLRARDYDPDTGTFLTQDPLDGVDSTPTVANPYHYADNDPLNRTDPTGLRPGVDGSEGPFGVSVHGCEDVPVVGERCLDLYIPTWGDAAEAVRRSVERARSAAAAALAVVRDNLLDQGAPAAKVNHLAFGSPSPRSDSTGRAIAQGHEAAGDAAPVECGRSEAYGLVVWCTSPVQWMPNATAAAYTVGHYVFCRRSSACKDGATLLTHELVHVDQFERYGDAFSVAYAIEDQRIRILGGDVQCDNIFEEEAYDEAGPPSECT